MTVVLAAAAAYEFGNVTTLDTTMGRFDPDYAFGCVTKSSAADTAVLLFETSLSEVWVHAKCMLGATGSAGDTGLTPVLGLFTENGVQIGGLFRNFNNYYLTSTNGNGMVISSLLTMNTLVDIDVRLYSLGSNRICELYISGNMIARHTSVNAWLTPRQLQMGGPGSGTNSYSEVMISQGDDPTLGWRLHSKMPDASLPGLNTFDSGYWGALANGSLTDGVVTTENNARLTGGFQAYTGPATPLGIRGILQSGRYLKNGTLLQLRGQLRIDDVNYDVPDVQVDNGNRVLSFWERNPATDEPFQVSDFAGLQGGFFTTL